MTPDRHDGTKRGGDPRRCDADGSAATATSTRSGPTSPRRRRRPDGALPLLRVQAALPLRDHGRGRSTTSSAASTAITAEHAGPARGARGRAVRLLRPHRAGRHAQPRARRPSRDSSACRRSSPREEEARRGARARARELEFAWASFLARAMRAGRCPESDPRLLSRALLGLYNSVWHWYRPDGIARASIDRGLLHGRALAMIGIGPDGVTRTRMVA